MLAGEDPNWGRVVAAVGASGSRFSKLLDVGFNGVWLLKNGRVWERHISRARNILRKREFVLNINLKAGKASARFLTSDLTKFYVWINSAYTS
jgi:glutamate N-acetyltransferase/amino-acid N-acetyltransferase